MAASERSHRSGSSPDARSAGPRYAEGRARPRHLGVDLLDWPTGRRNERARPADVDLTEGVVFVRYAKGAKQRIVPIGESAVEAVRAYLTHARPLSLKYPSVRALFLVSPLGGRAAGRRLRSLTINVIVHAVASKAGITRRVTTHTLRHSFATHLLRAGADVRYVQELLGHNRVDTTGCYTHLDVTDLTEAHRRRHPRAKQARTKPTT
ncbi:MAG: tyrosine-type recombinase/integrase [Acidobacteria bacterium]|nr:tyrosine-type recombinase/integrase [Acidobacteriota bacterium]